MVKLEKVSLCCLLFMFFSPLSVLSASHAFLSVCRAHNVHVCLTFFCLIKITFLHEDLMKVRRFGALDAVLRGLRTHL